MPAFFRALSHAPAAPARMSQRDAIGRGELTYKDGSRYVGDLVNRRRNGQGVLTWPNGERYEGGYVDEKRQGHGTYTWPGGHKFVVRLDVRCACYLLRASARRLSLLRSSLLWVSCAAGERRLPQLASSPQGEWIEDEKVRGTETFPDGSVYEGEYAHTHTQPSGALRSPSALPAAPVISGILRIL